MSGLYTPGLPSAILPFTGNETIPLDTNLPNGQYPELEKATISQLFGAAGMTPPWQASRFYGLPLGATPGTILTVTATLYAYPLYIPTTSTVKTLGIYTTTGQTGGAAHAGLYADNGAGYPGTLVSGSDGGALAATSSSAASTNTVNLTLNAGWYWLASIYTASSTFPTVTSVSATYGAATSAQIGFDTVAHLIATSGEAITGVSVAGTYGLLPTTFPSSATQTLNAGTPMVQLGT